MAYTVVGANPKCTGTGCQEGTIMSRLESQGQVLKLEVHRQALREDPEEAKQLQIHLLFGVC